MQPTWLSFSPYRGVPDPQSYDDGVLMCCLHMKMCATYPWHNRKEAISLGRGDKFVEGSRPLTKHPSQIVVHVLQVAAENRRKAATPPLRLAESAAAPLDHSPSAAHSASATEDGSLNCSCSGAAEQGQQKKVQNEKRSAVMPEPSQNSSAPNGVERRRDHEGADSPKQEAAEKHWSEPPALGSHGKEEEANGDPKCNGVHENASSQSPQQDDGPSSSIAPPVSSKDPQQPIKGPKDGAATQAAVQERQQRLMQSLIDGCDELADDHQQVRTFSGAQEQSLIQTLSQPSEVMLADNNTVPCGRSCYARPLQSLYTFHAVTECKVEPGRVILLHGMQESTKLRPIRMDDFEEALKDVVPTVSSESMVIEELKQWAAKFGEGGNRNAHNNSLTYFI